MSEEHADQASETAEAPVETTKTDPVTQAETDTTDYKAELAVKDAEIAQLRGQLNTAADDQQLKEKLSLELHNAINDRTDISTKYNEALKSKAEAAAAATKATLSTLDANADLQAKLDAYEAEKLKAEREREELLAKVTKMEVLTKEFPHILGYADRIINSTDAEAVRKDAEAFVQQRQADIEAFKRLGMGAALAAVPGAQPASPPVVTESADDSASRLSKLRSSMTSEADFNKARDEMIAAYEATRGATR